MHTAQPECALDTWSMIVCPFMSKEAQRQIAICYLLLKGEHWIPVSPDRRLTAVASARLQGARSRCHTTKTLLGHCQCWCLVAKVNRWRLPSEAH
jgi:hypothetical protein